jgi:hypothetical protein
MSGKRLSEISAEDLLKHYGQVGQVLDGLWFVELEKTVGFDRALAVDENVWKIFPVKEVRRMKSLLGFDKITFEVLQDMMTLAIFNQSLAWNLKKVADKPLIVHLEVQNCKTYTGMQKIGRSQEQIAKVCYEIGIAYFEAMFKELAPGTQISCLHCPGRSMPDAQGVCAWEFRFPV